MDAAVNPSELNEEDHAEIPEKHILTIFFEYFVGYVMQVLGFCESYGWIMFAAGLITLYVWIKTKPFIKKWLKEREEREYAAKYHKDPDLIMRRQEAIERARLKLAQQYEADAKRAAEKRKELEEKKREEWLLRQEGTWHPGYRLNGDSDNGAAGNNGSGGASNKKKPARLKEDYSPLMGDGSRGYRPIRRSACNSCH